MLEASKFQDLKGLTSWQQCLWPWGKTGQRKMLKEAAAGQSALIGCEDQCLLIPGPASPAVQRPMSLQLPLGSFASGKQLNQSPWSCFEYPGLECNTDY